MDGVGDGDGALTPPLLNSFSMLPDPLLFLSTLRYPWARAMFIWVTPLTLSVMNVAAVIRPQRKESREVLFLYILILFEALFRAYLLMYF